MKALNIPVGISNFEKIRNNGFYYVDKTGLIEELLKTEAEVTLITRPRRFGKTLGMSMLESFFDIRKNSRKLFEGLNDLILLNFCCPSSKRLAPSIVAAQSRFFRSR